MAKDQIEDLNVDDTSEKDLDQYGVWVSSESQDESGSDVMSDADAALLDLEDGSDDGLGDLNDLLMSIDEEGDQDDTIFLEEEDLDLDLDSDTADLFDVGNTDESGADLDGLDDLQIPGLDGDELSLSMDDSDDFSIPELDSRAALGSESLESAMDDFASSSELEEEVLEFDVGLDAPEDDESSDEEAPALISVGFEGPELVDEIVEKNDFIEDSLQIEDEVLDGTNTDLTEEPLDESIDMEVSFDDVDAVTNDMFATDSNELEPSSSMDAILEDDSFDDIILEDETDIAEQSHLDLDESVVDIPRTSASVAAETSVSTNESGTVLVSIEKELHAIRSELMDLRSELKRLRGASSEQSSSYSVGADVPVPTISDLLPEQIALEVDGPVDQGAESDTPKGFFEDDEDETIALTGDELDNILNSAEFTEEAGQPTEIDEEMSLEGSGLDGSMEPEISTTASTVASYEESGDQSAPPIEEIVLEEIQDIDEGLSIETEDSLAESSEDPVASMASLDIEKELAGIDDLSDGDSDIELFTDDDLSSIEIEVDDANQELDGNVDIDDTMSTEDDLAVSDIDLSEDNILDDMSSEEEGLLSSPAPVLPTKDATSLDGHEPLTAGMPYNIKEEIKQVLHYMDRLLDSLPQEKIEDFAKSEHFETYKKLFEELGI